MILDAGVLIAVDRGDRRAKAAIVALRRRGATVHTTEPVVAQVWRHGASQVPLAMVLDGAVIHPFADGRPVGRLLHAAGTRDVVDAHLVLLGARLGTPVLTGDPDDLQRLADALGPLAPTIHAWP